MTTADKALEQRIAALRKRDTEIGESRAAGDPMGIVGAADGWTYYTLFPTDATTSVLAEVTARGYEPAPETDTAHIPGLQRWDPKRPELKGYQLWRVPTSYRIENRDRDRAAIAEAERLRIRGRNGQVRAAARG